MSAQEVISSEEYCRRRGIEPVPSTESERIQAIFEHHFAPYQRRRPPLVAYAPWVVLGVVLGLTAFQVLKPWMPFVTA